MVYRTIASNWPIMKVGVRTIRTQFHIFEHNFGFIQRLKDGYQSHQWYGDKAKSSNAGIYAKSRSGWWCVWRRPNCKLIAGKSKQMFGKAALFFAHPVPWPIRLPLKVHTTFGRNHLDHNSHLPIRSWRLCFPQRVAVFPIEGTYGKITPQQIEAAIRPKTVGFPTSRFWSCLRTQPTKERQLLYNW